MAIGSNTMFTLTPG